MKEIGEELRLAREEHGVSIEEAAQDLNLRVSQIENIESGNLKVFKDVFYLKCFIRNYAKYLGLDDEKIIDEFNEFFFEETSKIPIKEIEKASIQKQKKERQENKIASPYTIDDKPKSKTIPIIIGIIIALLFFYIYMKYDGDTRFVVTTLNIDIDLGFFYGVFILLLLVGFSNAVNLTDGLDGLSGGLSLISFIAFLLISLFIGQEDIGIFCAILVGTLFGFLMFNAYPAKVFMGDTGSLALGAVFATIAILTRRELTLFIVCFPFVFETASSIIQIGYYKLTKKRVFLNSPIHHHFEKLGFQEPDIVKAFYLFGIIFSLLGIFFAVWI